MVQGIISLYPLRHDDKVFNYTLTLKGKLILYVLGPTLSCGYNNRSWITLKIKEKFENTILFKCFYYCCRNQIRCTLTVLNW